MGYKLEGQNVNLFPCGDK